MIGADELKASLEKETPGVVWSIEPIDGEDGWLVRVEASGYEYSLCRIPRAHHGPDFDLAPHPPEDPEDPVGEVLADYRLNRGGQIP